MEKTQRIIWLELCAEAAICEDSQRLAELTAYIVALLKEEQRKLDQPLKAHIVA